MTHVRRGSREASEGSREQPSAGAERQAEAADATAEERAWWQGMRDALACSHAMVLAVDRRGAICAAGPMAAQRLGETDVAGMLGEPASRFIAPAERARGARALEAVLAGQVWQGPLRLVSARGVERLLKLRVTPLRAGSGEISGEVMGAIAELDPAASGDGISRERLDAQSRMAGGLAHNFNNLLTVIRGSTYMLARELPQTSPLQAYVREVDEASDKAATWARQLGAIGRTIIYRPVPVDPNDLLREAMELLATAAPSGVTTRLELREGAPTVSLDPARLGQALRALVRNALDAVGEEGEIALGIEEVEVDREREVGGATLSAGAYLALVVRDDGPGMAPDVLAQVWEPYFTTRGPARGVGLGLPTAAAIARTSGGALEIHSEVDRGTTVRLLVPMGETASEAKPEVRAPTPKAVHAGGSRAVVLVVEDEPAVLRTVKATLQRAGMRPVAAHNAQQARRLLSTPGLHFDAAIFDVLLPDGRGDDVGHEARGGRPGLPIVFTSGFVASKPLSFQGDDTTVFLRKPFSPAELTRSLKELLAHA